MKIVLNKWFQLPYVGKETYSDLMKARVKRDSKFGFKFSSETNVTRALSVLSTALDEKFELARSCFVCDNPIEDQEESQGQESSLCSACTKNEDAYDLYMMKFAKLMENV
ncbi:MAG: hypothetical protein OK457_07470 [Thaumarchaeota archaeon]|nr:hypothetical protein [Nitrososphaerota archaeon]